MYVFKTNSKLGTRVSTKVTKVDIPQKEIYLDVKKIIKEKGQNYTKKIRD